MNKKKTIMIISLVTGLLLLTLGVTYAIFNLSKIGEKNSKLIVGDIYMHYKDTTNAINIENAMPLKEGYIVNPIMKSQSDTRNELAKCIDIISVMSLADGSTYESFCKGTGKLDTGKTFQEAYDSGTWFSDQEIQQFKNNNIITSDDKVNPIMQIQSDTRNELTKCIQNFAYEEYEEGSTPESFCKGTGKLQLNETTSSTFQEMYDNVFDSSTRQQLKNDNIITSDNKVNPIMQTQSDTRNELEKCINFFNGAPLADDSTYESLCKGTGKIQTDETIFSTFQEMYDNLFDFSEQQQLKNDNIITSNTKTLPYFEFTIDGKNTYTKKDIWYEIVLTHGDTKSDKIRIKDNLLKFTLTETKNGVTTTVFDARSYGDLTSKRVWVNTIDKNTTEEIKITYRLYMWISDDTKICAGDSQSDCDYYTDNTPSWSDVYASIKVDVTGDFEEKYIETNASCFNVNEIDNNGVTELEISSYMPSCGTDVVIPSEINGLKVTSIANCEPSPVSNNLDITPNNLNYYTNKKYNLKKTAYQSCAFKEVGLTSVILPKNLAKIGPYAFAGNQLTSVIIPNSVTVIGHAAFRGNQLTSVTMGNNVTTIEASAFEDNQLTNITIPNSVTVIGDSAFSGNQLTNVVIPDTVIEIGSAAFNNNKLSDNQAFIYERLDSNNDGVAEINTKKIVSYGGSNKEVIIPNGVTVIGDSAFSGNQLTNVAIPDSVTTIGDSAFYGNQLTSVTIGSSIKYIGSIAFYKDDYSNPNLSSIKINKTCSDIKNIPGSSTTTMKYYPWLNNGKEVTMYGLNDEVCDSYFK